METCCEIRFEKSQLGQPPQNLSVCAWSAHIDSAAWETEAGLVASCCHMPRNSRKRLLASRCATSTDEQHNTRWAPEQISRAWKRLFSTRECFAGEGKGLLELAGRSEAGRCGSKGAPGCFGRLERSALLSGCNSLMGCREWTAIGLRERRCAVRIPAHASLFLFSWHP